MLEAFLGKPQVSTGIVVGNLLYGQYRVLFNGQASIAVSQCGTLAPGQQVTIARTASGLVVVAAGGTSSTSKSITIAFGGSASGPRDVVLTIKDYCSDLPIPGATVALTVNTVVTTLTADVNGQVTFLQVPVGTWPVTVTAPGYLTSGSDTLANDSITV